MFPGSKMYYNLPFRFFGCTVFVHIPTQFRLKLDHRAEKRVFVDYSPNQKGYKCYSPIKKKCFFFWLWGGVYKNVSQTGGEIPHSQLRVYTRSGTKDGSKDVQE